MEQKFKFIEIQKFFTILLWRRLFPVHLYCSMSKLMEFAFLGEEESCWCFAVAHSLSSSPLLKHVDMILRCVEENVSKSTVSSAEVDRNNDISLNWSLRSHGFQSILKVMQTETIMKSKRNRLYLKRNLSTPRNKCSIILFHLHKTIKFTKSATEWSKRRLTNSPLRVAAAQTPCLLFF